MAEETVKRLNEKHQGELIMSPADTPKKSPLHPHYQAKLGAKVGVVSSPSRGLAPLTPGRSRNTSITQGSDTAEPDKSPSVPKFGEWDENDPSSADGYTQIFNIVREERQGGAGSTPSMGADNRFSNNRNHNSKGCCCFPWRGN